MALPQAPRGRRGGRAAARDPLGREADLHRAGVPRPRGLDQQRADARHPARLPARPLGHQLERRRRASRAGGRSARGGAAPVRRPGPPCGARGYLRAAGAVRPGSPSCSRTSSRVCAPSARMRAAGRSCGPPASLGAEPVTSVGVRPRASISSAPSLLAVVLGLLCLIAIVALRLELLAAVLALLMLVAAFDRQVLAWPSLIAALIVLILIIPIRRY